MTTVATPLAWNPVSRPGHGLSMGQLAARTASIAVRALLREAEAGPKPGLVDRFGPGVHTDMDISHFRLSTVALGPFFELIILESALFGADILLRKDARTGLMPDGLTEDLIEGQSNDTLDYQTAFARRLRTLGLQAESAMLAATGGVNTHKGAIWTIGLLCAAVGSLIGYGYSAFCAEEVCAQAARIAQAILSPGPACNPLAGPVTGVAASSVLPPSELTNGLAARQTYGLRSARDEALAGFPSLQTRALPLARSLRASTLNEDDKVISVLLAVMCELDDTCLAARGGLPALELAKTAASQVLESGGPFSATGAVLYRQMVADFQSRKLSPGGSADLCAATLFLTDIETGSAGGLPASHRLTTT